MFSTYTTPLNADFDTDEGNLYILQGLDSKTEAEEFNEQSPLKTISLAHSKDILSSIASQLDSIKDIVSLKRLGKEFNEQLSSSEFAKYYHWKRHGYNPPDILHYWNPDENRLEETPWRLEFSFIPMKFFFATPSEDKLYLNALLAYKNALSEKQEQEAEFISRFFPGIEITDLERYTLVISPSSEGNLSRGQIEYVTRVYDEARYNKTIPYRDKESLRNKYITSLAQYGDIEYFEEILSSKLASENQDTPKKYVSARTLALRRPSRQIEEPPLPPNVEKERIKANFTESMIEQGKERLLEAYNKYRPKMEEHHVYIPVRYHPDQWKIEDLDRDHLRVLEAASTSNEDLFSLVKNYKEEEGEFIEEIEAELDTNLDFLKWMLRHHPELVPDWYANQDNIYLLTKFYQEVEDVGHHLDTYVLPTYPQEGSWEEIIAWTEFTDKGLKDLLRKITSEYPTLNYPLFFEILEWDEEKTLTLLQELREEKGVRRRPLLVRSLGRRESQSNYSYDLLLAALSS